MTTPTVTRKIVTALLFAAATAGLVANGPAVAQPPPGKDDKDKDKGKAAAPASPLEQQALEAFAAGKVEEASKLLKEANKNNPAATPPTFTFFKWFAQAKKGQEARVMLEQAMADDPGHPEVLLTNANISINEGRLTDTILNCEAALKAATAGRWGPDDRKRFTREARNGLAAALERRGDRGSQEAARKYVRDMLDDDPKNPQLQVRLAVFQFLLDQPDLARAALAEAYATDPTLDPPELVIGQLWMRKGDKDKAEAALKEAIKNHGNPPAARATDADKAKAATAGKVQRAYAEYLLAQGNKGAAVEYLNAAKKIDPDARETRTLEGVMARYNKDWPAAEKIFSTLQFTYPSNSQITANLAVVLAESGDAAQRKRGVELAQLAFSQNQQNAEMASYLGYCLFKDGRVDEADRVLAQVFQAMRQNGQYQADAVYFTALVADARAKDEEVRKQFRRLLTEVLKQAKGGFVYRPDADALLKKMGGPLEPEKKEPEKK